MEHFRVRVEDGIDKANDTLPCLETLPVDTRQYARDNRCRHRCPPIVSRYPVQDCDAVIPNSGDIGEATAVAVEGAASLRNYTVLGGIEWDFGIMVFKVAER